MEARTSNTMCAPKVVIEAKVAEDDGTARDKVTRVQHLDALSRQGQPAGKETRESPCDADPCHQQTADEESARYVSNVECPT